jgi:hypothetical protein
MQLLQYYNCNCDCYDRIIIFMRHSPVDTTDPKKKTRSRFSVHAVRLGTVFYGFQNPTNSRLVMPACVLGVRGIAGAF